MLKPILRLWGVENEAHHSLARRSVGPKSGADSTTRTVPAPSGIQYRGQRDRSWTRHTFCVGYIQCIN